MEPNVEQALRELEEDADYQFLRSYKIKNAPAQFSASEILPSTDAEGNYTLYNGYLADKPVEYIKNAIKAAYFLLAVLDTFVHKARETKHEFTFKGEKVYVEDLGQNSAKSIFNGGYFSIKLDKPYLINLYKIEVAKSSEDMNYTNGTINFVFRFQNQGTGPALDYRFRTSFDKMTDIFTFSNFQKIIDKI